MSTLVLDARWLNTGLGTYTLNLIREISQCQNIQLRLLTLPQYREYLAKYNCAITIVDTPIYSIQEQFTIAWASRGSRVLHVPHYNAPLTRVGSLLVTIHDLTHILDHAQRRSIKSWIYAQPMLGMVSRRADHIFTVSEYSKRQIVELLGVNPERITVVYNGVGPHLFPEPRDEARAKTNRDFSFVGPYILFVGNLKPFKNVAGLIKAFSLLKERSRLPYRLLVIGDDAAGRPGLIKLAMQLGLDGSVIFVLRVSDEQVRAAYSGADLTVLPSLEEGFGLPVVESMTCGTRGLLIGCVSARDRGPGCGIIRPSRHRIDSEFPADCSTNSDRWSELRQLIGTGRPLYLGRMRQAPFACLPSIPGIECSRPVP